MSVLARLRAALRITCDEPGCDRDPEPILLSDGLRFLCPEHTVEAVVAEIDGGQP